MAKHCSIEEKLAVVIVAMRCMLSSREILSRKGISVNVVGADGRVIAFKAFPDNARLLQEGCSFWGYGESIRVENVAVSDGMDDRL